MSRAKGNRTIREKAEPYYEGLGFFVDRVEHVSRYAKKQDLLSTIFDMEDEKYTAKGFDIIALNERQLILVQVATNNPKTQKWYKEFAKRYAHERMLVQVFTHYDSDGFRIQNYLPNGKIIEADLRKSQNDYAKRSFFWWEGLNQQE